MFLNVIYFRHLEILYCRSLFTVSIFSQRFDNLFLTVKTIFNWNFQSVATSTVQPLRKECGDLNEVASDNDDGKDDDDVNSKDVEVAEIGTGETLTMLDRLVDMKYLSMEERKSLVAMEDKLEKIRVLNKKQSHISDYFMLE